MDQQDNNNNNITSETGSIDFIDQFVDGGLNSDHLIELLRGAPPHIPHASSAASSVTDTFFHNPELLMVSLGADHDLGSFGPTPEDLFELGSSRSGVFDDPSSILNSLSGMEDDMKFGGDEDEDDDNETDNSSATATTPSSGGGSKKPKLDRTRTLISERKRRGRMKDKLYALRALVPNITKMDKASIVGDAVLYVQNLQMQAKKLKADIVELESSLKDGNRSRGFVQDSKRNPIARILVPAPKIISQMDVFQVEEREFYVRIRSNKGQGVAVSLYKALESLSNAIVRNSNLTTACEKFILAFTLNVGGEWQEDVNLPSLKMWISRAFINQGFDFGTV